MIILETTTNIEKICETFTHEDVEYVLSKDKTYSLYTLMINEGINKHLVVYESDNNHIIVDFNGDAQSMYMFENTKTVIGSQIELMLLSFNNNEPIIAKVDTGASYCSLHATDINIAPSAYKGVEQVSFNYRGQTYRMPLVNKQSVQNSDGGVSYRPVVKFNINMNGKTYEDVLFNLNDRSDMSHDILLGQNLLQQSRVLVDPTMFMEAEFELATALKLINENSNVDTDNHPLIDAFYKMRNMTLQDLLLANQSASINQT